MSRLNECCFLSYHHRHLNHILPGHSLHESPYPGVMVSASLRSPDAWAGCANDQYDQEDPPLCLIALI